MPVRPSASLAPTRVCCQIDTCSHSRYPYRRTVSPCTPGIASSRPPFIWSIRLGRAESYHITHMQPFARTRKPLCHHGGSIVSQALPQADVAVNLDHVPISGNERHVKRIAHAERMDIATRHQKPRHLVWITKQHAPQPLRHRSSKLYRLSHTAHIHQPSPSASIPHQA